MILRGLFLVFQHQIPNHYNRFFDNIHPAFIIKNKDGELKIVSNYEFGIGILCEFKNYIHKFKK